MDITRNDWNKLFSTVLKIQEDVASIRAEYETELLTPKEVQSMLQIGKTTYQRYMDNNVFKQIKIEGKAYVQRSEITRLIEEGKI